MPFTLFEFQHHAVENFRCEARKGKQHIVLVAPTGSGKTVIGAEIIRDAVANGQRVLVLAHRREIIAQTSQKLFAAGVDHGIVQAGFRARPQAPVQVASIATLWIRSFHLGKTEPPPADLILVDECHHAPAKTYAKIIRSYSSAIVLGLTATPCRET
jgi:DNA repair protein RadD